MYTPSCFHTASESSRVQARVGFSGHRHLQRQRLGARESEGVATAAFQTPNSTDTCPHVGAPALNKCMFEYARKHKRARARTRARTHTYPRVAVGALDNSEGGMFDVLFERRVRECAPDETLRGIKGVLGIRDCLPLGCLLCMHCIQSFAPNHPPPLSVRNVSGS